VTEPTNAMQPIRTTLNRSPLTLSHLSFDTTNPLRQQGLSIRVPCDVRHVAACVAALLVAQSSLGQMIVPVPPPGGAQRQAAPARELPPVVSESERRFRTIVEYVRTRGELDSTTRADVVRLAGDLDTELVADGAPIATVMRLLAARIQIALWLNDRDARDAAFERLVSMQTNKDATLIAWARELVADADFERAYQILETHPFAAERLIDARILQAGCLFAFNRFSDAQAMLNTAPPQRSAAQMTAIAQLTARIQLVEPLWEAETAAMARDQSQGDLPVVELITSKGAITLELFEDQAPNTVANMIEHVDAGTYNGTLFHRVLRGLGVQGGDPATAVGGVGGTSTGGWTIPDEHTRESKRAPLSGRVIVPLQPDPQGGKEPLANSGGCQFMILLNHFESIQSRFTVFGRVTEGLDVARRLTPDDMIVTARVLTKRDRAYQSARASTDATGSFTLPLAPPVSRPPLPGSPGNQAPAPSGAPSGFSQPMNLPPEAVRDMLRSTQPAPESPKK
jgi:cyclophilin family peptidyl-prolyl cis-trans isomerase